MSGKQAKGQAFASFAKLPENNLINKECQRTHTHTAEIQFK